MTFWDLKHLVILTIIVARQLVACCSFPDVLQMKTYDPPWYSHIRSNGSRDAEYYIRHNVMEIHNPKSDRPNVRFKCKFLIHDKFLLKRQDHLVNDYFRCAKFEFRSQSVVQIFWSHEVRSFDLSLCDDVNLVPDPWILVSYETLKDDYTPCPISGGFDMKIVDSVLGENGCNFMLRPMRLEAECLGGEGVQFNFMSSNCLPTVNMYVKQTTTCVTGWQDDRNNYIILRRSDDIDLWCLVVPLQGGANTTAHLFSDLACVSDAAQLKSNTADIRYLTLILSVRVFLGLCEDEYDQCNSVTCNTYVKQECQRSCGVCSVSQHPLECEFPADSVGEWFLRDSAGYSNITITSSMMKISDVGSFFCVSFPNGPTQPSPLHTTISITHNGCRPRFTCIKLHMVGPSVLQYSISQSYTWPASELDLGLSVCSDDRFQSDPSPVDDRYRSYKGAGKPIININIIPVVCNISSVYTVNATFSSGHHVTGSLYRHCEDATKLRLDFSQNGRNTSPVTTDYTCLANYEGHYWETIVLVNNVHDDKDALCFVFSQYYPNEAYSLVASECDQTAFGFAKSGLRKPLLKLDIQVEQDSCQSVATIPSIAKQIQLDSYPSTLDNSFSDDYDNHIAIDHITSPDLGYHIPIPVEETGAEKSLHIQHKGTLLDMRSNPDTPSAKSTSISDEDSFQTSNNNGAQPSTAYVSMWIFLLVSLRFFSNLL